MVRTQKGSASPHMSDTRALIVELIEDSYGARGYPPTVRELMEGAGLNSPASVQHHLKRLAADGVVEWEAGKTRTIRLTGGSDGSA
jgi:repressor LexA